MAYLCTNAACGREGSSWASKKDLPRHVYVFCKSCYDNLPTEIYVKPSAPPTEDQKKELGIVEKSK